ncbi:MAG TPA: ARMT1-like domain-containing protein [Phycisphaerae bacterium]|nr:ARMT1-like domain-containing protein [Phycisphaerae bacterium]
MRPIILLPMPVLPLLREPSTYRACIQDLLADGAEVREYWLRLFEEHVRTLARLPVEGGGHLEGDKRWGAFKADYLAGLAELRERPSLRGRLTVLELTVYRDEKLDAHGFIDPFKPLKDRENALALRVLPGLLKELDSAAPGEIGELLARGFMAGNQFDMGSRAVVEAFEAGTFEFRAARDKVRRRPWGVDDLDRWRARLESGPVYGQCLFFVDNCGCDIVLGVLPIVRELLGRGTRVVLAANSRPSLNDITATELEVLLGDCRRLDALVDAALGDERLLVVASGCGSPLIDLAQVSEACCEAAAKSDLLIIEGMGRAIESNYDAAFTVDTLKMALIKDPMVAKMIGVELFDPVFRYEAAGDQRPSRV